MVSAMILSSYIAKNIDLNERMKSQSGGIFAVLSDYILLHSGVVYGCTLDERLNIYHKRIVDYNERNQFGGSKYVQSDISNCFEEVKNDLDNGKMVLFSGTPCQVDGLKSYCKNINTNNLWCIDIICHGVPSQLIFKEYIEYLSKKYNGAIEGFNFRNKKLYEWQTHVETFIINGVNYSETLFKELFYRENILRPSCYECTYKRLNTPGDITLGDAWGIDTIDSDFNDRKGTSLVLINTEKGIQVFNAVKESCMIRKVSMDHYTQSPLIKPSKRPKQRDYFWKDYREKDFNFIIKKYAEVNNFHKLKRKIKKIILFIMRYK